MSEENYRILDDNYDSKIMEPVNCQNIFSEWSEEHLIHLAEERGLRTHFSKSELKKSDATMLELLVEEISVDVILSGTKLLIKNDFSRDVLEQLTAPMDKSDWDEPKTKKDGEKLDHPYSKNFLAKRLYAKVEEFGGLALYIKEIGFNSGEVRDIYRGLLNYFGADTESTSRKTLFIFVEEEIHTFCLQNVLTGLPAKFLQAVCNQIKIRHGDSTSSNILADCIINGTDYEKKQRVKAAVSKLTSKPKKISGKLKKVDLTTWFKATELTEFCRDTGLRHSGKKVELAQRIVDFYDPNKENDVPGLKAEKKRARKETSPAPTKKGKETATTKPKSGRSKK